MVVINAVMVDALVLSPRGAGLVLLSGSEVRRLMRAIQLHMEQLTADNASTDGPAEPGDGLNSAFHIVRAIRALQ